LARKKRTIKVYVDYGMNVICVNRRVNYVLLDEFAKTDTVYFGKNRRPIKTYTPREVLHDASPEFTQPEKAGVVHPEFKNPLEFKLSEADRDRLDKALQQKRAHEDRFRHDVDCSPMSLDEEVRANNLPYAEDVERFAEFFWPNYNARGKNGKLKREVLARFKRMVKDHMFTAPIATKDELREEISRIEKAKTGDTVGVKDPALFNSISLEDLKKELGL
jgi:hypothetical protein